MRTHTASAYQYEPRVDETQLITRVLDGDREAARQLYDAHAPRVYRLVFRLCGDEELARDFTQDTFVRAFDQLARFRGDAAFSTWLHRIAVTTTSNAMRKVKRQWHRETAIDGIAEPAAPPTADTELQQRLAAAIDALPEIYRTTLVMHDIEGFTHPEIARTLGVPEGTCKSRLFQARAQLRRVLAPLAEELE